MSASNRTAGAIGGLRQKATNARTELNYQARKAGALLDGIEARGDALADAKFDGDTRVGRAAQTGTVLTVVTLGITILVGILIYSQVDSSLPSPTNSDLQDASTNSTSTFADAMELAPVIMIILLAAVILAVVQRFR